MTGWTIASAGLRRGWRRALAVSLTAATLALWGTIISASPIATHAAVPTGPNSAWAWGGNPGNGSPYNSSTPVPVNLPSGTTVTALAGGSAHSLALTSTGQVMAWGDNTYGSLGNGTTISTTSPIAVSLPSGTTVTAIAAGSSDSLALTSTGQILAWGWNHSGQLGNGTTTNSSTPVLVSLPTGTTAIAVAAGGQHSLALTSTGRVLAWGADNYAQLGTGTASTTGCLCVSTPVAVSLPLATTITAITGGGNHSLALTSTGQVLAWGFNDSGQIGNGTTTTSGCWCIATPVQANLPSTTTATAVAGGGGHSLALTSTGQVLAWGYNYSGQLGNGTTLNSNPTPGAVNLPSGTTVTAIAGGGSHSLALTSTAQVLVWGDNGNVQLGTGTIAPPNSSTPLFVSSVRAASAIAGGGIQSMAIQQLAAVAVFPAMSNGAYGGYVTASTIQNIGSAPAIVRILYFNQSGSPVGVGDATNNLPVNASWTVRQDNGNSFPSSYGNAVQAGSAIVYSSQPIASFVNEFPPGNIGDATSYTGVQVPSGIGATLYAPIIVNNGYGGYTTGIGLLNQGSTATDVTITYRGADGVVVKTQTVTALAAHAYQALYSGDTTLALPNLFAGTATITNSAAQPLGAVVNETGPGGQFSSYDAVPSGSTSLKVPVALNNAYSGFFTGFAIQNTSSINGLVAVTYYDAAGTATGKAFTIAPFGYLGVYQGSATDGPAPGSYTAVIDGPAAMAVIVNEFAPAGSGAARQSTSFNTFSSGSSTVHVALVENGGSDPWNTSMGIMNTGSASTTVTVTYYDAVTGAPIGTAPSQVVASHAYWGLYQPIGGLPAGSRATAVITTSSGGQVAAVCNETSPTTFMSYNGQ